MALPVPRAVRVALGLARLCALVVCAAGALVLASWHFDFSALDPLFPDLHSMAPNAAAGCHRRGARAVLPDLPRPAAASPG